MDRPCAPSLIWEKGTCSVFFSPGKTMALSRTCRECLLVLLLQVVLICSAQVRDKYSFFSLLHLFTDEEYISIKSVVLSEEFNETLLPLIVF